MKGSRVFTYIPLLVLVSQASCCLASRSGASRSLLQTTVIIEAGTQCVSGDLCSNGDGTSTPCTSGTSQKCPLIPAGLSCKTKDQCRLAIDGAAGTAKTPSSTLCPVDPDTKNGTCPTIAPDSTCSAKDRCSTDATSTSLCPTSASSPTSTSLGWQYATCPSRPSGASCSQLSGPCSTGEMCSAANSFAQGSINAVNLFAQDPTVGTCVKPKAGGAGCTVGSDYCQNQVANKGSTYCPSSPCALIRPGQHCSNSAPIDRCYNGGVNANGVPCDTTGNCLAIAADGACYAGDLCTGLQVCNAVGANVGKCVAVVTPGASCQSTVVAPAADGSGGKSIDFCRVVTTDPTSGLVSVSAQTCTGTTCPYVPAGQPCLAPGSGAKDLCSDGGKDTTSAQVCPTGNAPATGSAPAYTANFCPIIQPLVNSNLGCYLGDQCDSTLFQYCTATGVTSATKGVCQVSKAAGQACAKADVCAPTGAACPASLVCPPVSAGAVCALAVSSTRPADKCFNGNTDPTKATTDCPAGLACPALATGSTCSATDLCVKGAKCTGGKCYPVTKVFATTVVSSPSPTTAAKTASTGFSSAATVPSVSAVATLPNYAVANFSSSVQSQYCSTIESNILTSFGVVSNCSVGAVSAGSVVVPTTVAFSGADSTKATAAQSAFAAALNAKDTSVFGSNYGTVSVASVQTGSTSNPEAAPTSGAGAVGFAWTVGVGLMVSAVAMAV